MGKSPEPESGCAKTHPSATFGENSSITTLPGTHPALSSFLSPPHADLQDCGSPTVSPLCHLPPASLLPLQLAPPTLSQNARPGPGVIAARDSSWHKCWHSVGITCNNVCRLHPSRAIIITSRQEIVRLFPGLISRSQFHFESRLVWRNEKERRPAGMHPGNRAAWPGLCSTLRLEEPDPENSES